MSASSFVTVLIDTSAIRDVARMLMPSTSRLMIWTRFSMESRFVQGLKLLIESCLREQGYASINIVCVACIFTCDSV